MSKDQTHYDVVFFDADETLFDFKRAEVEAFAKFYDHFHLETSGEDQASLFAIYKGHNHTLWDLLERGEVTAEVLRTERFSRFFAQVIQSDGNENLKLPTSGEAAQYFENALGEGHFLLPNALELLTALHKHVKIGIITNGLGNVQEARISNSPIAHLIETLVISEEAGYAKPHPRIFHTAVKRMGQGEFNAGSHGRMLMVGDSLVSDIAGAIAFGIDSCWYNPKALENETKFKPTYVIKDLLELVPLILK